MRRNVDISVVVEKVLAVVETMDPVMMEEGNPERRRKRKTKAARGAPTPLPRPEHRARNRGSAARNFSGCFWNGG